jgi:hypothetical protein
VKNSTKIETRAWAPGDLVKINTTTGEGQPHKSIGIVLKEMDDNPQTSIFPTVLIYDLHSSDAREFYIYEIELISTIQ